MERPGGVRFGTCKLVLHPQKTKLVYCKDANRRGDYPVQAFDFLGYEFRPRTAVWRDGRLGVSFQPAAESKGAEGNTADFPSVGTTSTE